MKAISQTFYIDESVVNKLKKLRSIFTNLDYFFTSHSSKDQ